jgi:hypothetical protein
MLQKIDGTYQLPVNHVYSIIFAQIHLRPECCSSSVFCVSCLEPLFLEKIPYRLLLAFQTHEFPSRMEKSSRESWSEAMALGHADMMRS